METSQIKRLLEGLLFVSDQPMTIKRLKQVVEGLEADALHRLIDELNAQYLQGSHAFQIQEVAGGYQLVTDPQLAPLIKQALELPQQDTLRKPALETLAIIVYRQPITKAEIEVIRGVDGGATLETLLERGFVRVVGRKETPGRPLLYGTTDEFLRHFGLKDLSELPPMADINHPPALPGEQPASTRETVSMPVASSMDSGSPAASEPAPSVGQPSGDRAIDREAAPKASTKWSPAGKPMALPSSPLRATSPPGNLTASPGRPGARFGGSSESQPAAATVGASERLSGQTHAEPSP